jgi:hypothetical protein
VGGGGDAENKSKKRNKTKSRQMTWIDNSLNRVNSQTGTWEYSQYNMQIKYKSKLQEINSLLLEYYMYI